MLPELSAEIERRKVIHGIVDKIILDHFDFVDDCHTRVRRSVAQKIVRDILKLKDSYQARRVVTERMTALGFKPIQLHGRGFYKNAKLKDEHDNSKGIESARLSNYSGYRKKHKNTFAENE